MRQEIRIAWLVLVVAWPTLGRAQDVVVQPGAGDEFVVRNSAGTVDVLRVLESSGTIIIDPDGGTPTLIVNGPANQVQVADDLSVGGDITLSGTGGRLFLGTGLFLHDASVFGNTFVGRDAGDAITTGQSNTGVGNGALGSSEAGGSNTAVGASSLFSNTSGTGNVAVGRFSLDSNLTGSNNVAVGRSSLGSSSSTHQNTALGTDVLSVLTSGNSNVGVGTANLKQLQTGTGNLALGSSAGFSLTNGSSNVYIANAGASIESNTIRIGSSQTATFVAGIDGATVAGGTAVFVNSSGQLGTLTSSARFKRDVADLEGSGERLMELRPVSFRYLDQEPVEYGLIAEEVARVAPELVVYDAQQRPHAVRYHLLTPMLLDETQRQRRTLDALGELVEAQRALIDRLEARVRDLETAASGDGEGNS